MEEEGQKTYPAFNVLFSSEKDFLTSDGGLPELSQSCSFFLVKDRLIKHETLSHRVLKHGKMLLGLLLLGSGLAAGILAVDKELDRRVLVGLHLLYYRLVEGVHVKGIKCDCRN